MRKRIIKTDYCQNCDTYQGKANFCPNCGQPNNSRKPNAWELVVEAIENLFAFDSRFYHSLAPLLWKPGKMTLEFSEGKRMQYVAPLRLFILMTLLMLFTFSCEDRMSKEHWYDITPPTETRGAEIVRYKIEGDDLASPVLDSLIETGDVYLDTASDGYFIAPASRLRDTMNFGIDDEYLSKMNVHARLHPEQKVDDALAELGMEPTFWNHLFYSNLHKIGQMNAEEFGKYIRGNLLVILLLFIPMMALLLKILYLNQHIYYVDHFIFAIHGQTTLFAYLTTLGILDLILPLEVMSSGMVYLLLIALFTLYIVIAIKRYYREGWVLTIAKFLAMNIGLFFVSLIFILLVATVSVILY